MNITNKALYAKKAWTMDLAHSSSIQTLSVDDGLGIMVFVMPITLINKATFWQSGIHDS